MLLGQFTVLGEVPQTPVQLMVVVTCQAALQFLQASSGETEQSLLTTYSLTA